MRNAIYALTGIVLLAYAASAQTYPLPASSGSTTAFEGSAPFLLSEGMTQSLVVNRDTLNSQGLPVTFGVWDMVTYDLSGRYIFVPSEIGSGAGLFRYDKQTGTFVNLMVGNASGTRQSNPAVWDANNDDFSRFDPCTLTPWNSVITGEETTGGRLFEVTNPLSAGPYNAVWRDKIPAVAHEGMRFDQDGNLYLVDEDNSGSIYKFVPLNAGDLSVGQSFVLCVDAFNGNAALTWNNAANIAQPRIGAATWVPITDAMGNALTTADPFAFVTTTGGRTAADEIGGTPYGRPEDFDVNVLANGNEALYVAVTSEHSVYTIELLGPTTAHVRVFCDRNTVNEAGGQAIGTGLTSPDNLAVDHFGNVYVIEDQNPGDVFKCRDEDKDGVAESMGRLVSLGVGGSEPTGFIAHPTEPYLFLVAVQHPSSSNDALWEIDTRAFHGTKDGLELSSGVNEAPSAYPGESIKRASGLDTIHFGLNSPDGAHVATPFYFFFDLYATGVRPYSGLEFLHVDVPTAVVVVNPVPSILPSLLPASGFQFMAVVPPGLAGISVMFQGAALSGNAANGFVTVSNGQELQLTF